MDKCKTCQHWEPVTKLTNAMHDKYNDGGHCGCEKIREDTGGCEIDELVYSYNESGSFWTGPEFGCIHHKPLANQEK